jgi:hypothetical protein
MYIGELLLIIITKGEGPALFDCPYALNYLKGMERLLNESTTVEKKALVY